MTTGDTIVAISSAVGPAPRMIVRASGPDAIRIARSRSSDFPQDVVGSFSATLSFADLVAPATFYVFRAPNSYSGEDLVEFHIPGNPLLARMLIDTLVKLGARTADPGEFTARAYFNGRLDLTEAEGVAMAVTAGSEQELRAARRLLAGELARRLRPTIDLIAETLALIEVGIDFSDDDVTFLKSEDLAQRIERSDLMLRDLLDNSARFERLAHEPQIVLVGRPNAGKSTLLNALAGHERAVTSPVAGTTRDVLTAEVALARGIVRLTDAAGIEARLITASDIERQMRENALRAVESADVIVLVNDASDESPTLELLRRPDLVVFTKSDLARANCGAYDLFVSAKTGENLDRLRDELDRIAFGDVSSTSASLALNARHVRAVSDACDALARAKSARGAELIALELRETLDALGGVVGMVSPDELLGRIFSAFCIGK